MSELSKAIKQSADKVEKYYEKKLKEDPNYEPEINTEINIEPNDKGTYTGKIKID